MHPQQARELVAQQLPSQADQRFFIQQGHANYRATDGSDYFLWVPDDEPYLYFYGHLADLIPETSSELLARALALNIEHSATFHGAISLNLQTHQLIFRDTHAVSIDLNTKQLLSKFIKVVSNLRLRLEGAGADSSPRSMIEPGIII